MQPQDPNTPNQQAPQPQQQPAPAEQQPQPMYWSRPYSPQAPAISPEIQQKCEESQHKYPRLNLSEGEYVISDVKRHPIGLLGIWAIAALIIVAVLSMLAVFMNNANGTGLTDDVPRTALALGVLLVATLVAIGAAATSWIYGANHFYLTNESVIQHLQISLFSSRVQTVSLGNVEDASYTKKGIVQHLFDYGSIRLSTQGDETTYRFSFVSNPHGQIAALNDAVEAYKNGRPFEHHA
ncbi:hypothetical protein BH09PAT4_BH09PAT4_02110 [soil metagenome]